MTSKAKKYLTISAVAISAFWLYGFKKYQAAKNVLNHVKVGIKKISDLNLTWRTVMFNAVFTLQNTSAIDFGATLGSKIAIKRIQVFNKEGVFLGNAKSHITEIDLPANQTVTLPETRIELDLNSILNEFLSNTNAYLGNDFSNLIYKIDVELFGKRVTLEPNT